MTQKFSLILCLLASSLFAQTNPVITKWLQNNSGITGRHYISGNATPIVDEVAANVQNVQYSASNVYVTTNGIPAYITGPFLDRNPYLATSQNGAVFKFPLNPTKNLGTPTPTTGGNIGIFINGVALFDYRDGVAWDNTAGALCGGPGRTSCSGTQAWNRDAILAERGGFDCAKAHPANGNYHHHQNPSAFNLDLNSLSTVCDTYPSDGLYVINTAQHSPLIGYAYDGFPIYGAYGYAKNDGTGGITRIKSSYQLRTNTTRLNGPDVNTTYPNGYFREDYEFVNHSSEEDYLDVHNGRFCQTPEYPNGIYCYFATVDANHNSAYPYVVGPTFYGNKTAAKVTTISESTSSYLGINDLNQSQENFKLFPNPAQDFIAIQSDLVHENLKVELLNELGQVVKTSSILQGSTLAIIETDVVYNGLYFVKITSNNKIAKTFKVVINK